MFVVFVYVGVFSPFSPCQRGSGRGWERGGGVGLILLSDLPKPLLN